MRNQSKQYEHHQLKMPILKLDWLMGIDDTDILSRYWNGILYASMGLYEIPNASTYVSINVAPQDAVIYAAFLADCGIHVNSIKVRDNRNAFRFTSAAWIEFFRRIGYDNLIKERSLQIDNTDNEVSRLRADWVNSQEFARGYCDAAGMYRSTSKILKFSIPAPENVLLPLLHSEMFADMHYEYQKPHTEGGNARATFYDDDMRKVLNRLGYVNPDMGLPVLPSTTPLIELLKTLNKVVSKQ